MSNTLKVSFGYDDETTRKYQFDIADSLMPAVKSKIKAVNASLNAGTAGGLSTFFLSDDGANFVSITSATLDSLEIIDLNLGEEA